MDNGARLWLAHAERTYAGGGTIQRTLGGHTVVSGFMTHLRACVLLELAQPQLATAQTRYPNILSSVNGKYTSTVWLRGAPHPLSRAYALPTALPSPTPDA